MKRALVWIAAALLLGGCAARLPRVNSSAAEQALSGRESRLFEHEQFELSGRIGISNGKDAGSGQFRWQQRGAAFDFSLVVTLTGDRFRLAGQPGKVLLTDAKGVTSEGFDAEQMLMDRTGWRVPVTELGYWVRAMRAPGSPVQPRFADDGKLAELRQSGWSIEYKRWNEADPALPLMLIATRGKDRVRVRVSEWQ